MRWRTLGRVFGGEGQFPWMMTHAALPVAEHIEADLYRVYFTARDAKGRSHVGWLEIDVKRPDRVLRLSESPILGPGAPGSFDDAGATLSSIVRHEGKRYAFYFGWHLRKTPYHLSIGLALGSDASEPVLTRLDNPIMDANEVDPLFCASPFVRRENGRWRMWYVSGTGWPKEGGRVVPAYNTRYAESENGVDWVRSGRVMLATREGEFGFSRPCVLRDGNGYSMWYSIRGPGMPYRPGFARSPDGLVWTRDDSNAGLAPSADGWDSEMITYPHVFDHGPDRYMLYCGNGYGRTGFGLAVLD
jgi:hypothetical protein